MRKTLLPLLIIVLAFVFAPAGRAADVGPKPSMDFEFVFAEGQPPLEIESGVMLVCDQADCSDARPLEELGPQGFRCTATTCSAMFYSTPEYTIIEVRFSDGVTRRSNIFTKPAFASTYRVQVGETDLNVRYRAGAINPSLLFFGLILAGGGAAACVAFGGLLFALAAAGFWVVKGGQAVSSFASARWLYAGVWLLALIVGGIGVALAPTLPLTLAIEALLALLYARLRKLPRLSLVTAVLLVNLVTQPLLLLVLYSVDSGFSWGLTLGAEAAVFAIEALLLYFMQRPNLRPLEAALLSLLLNAISFSAGLFLPI